MPLRLILMRKPPGACPPEILGATDVFLTEEMCKTIRKAMTSMEDMPMSSTLQDSYNLRNDKQEDVGFITVFVRLSCFGQSIVTQFKLVNETNSFLFKNSKEATSFECEDCSCGQEEQSDRKLTDSPCGCPADNVVTYSKDCDSQTCDNKRIPMKPEQYPPTTKDCDCVDKTRPKSSTVCGDAPKSSSPCGVCGTSQQKPQDCGPSYPCGSCGQSKTKSQDCGPAYPCGVCSQDKKPKSNDCGPSYPCGFCGTSNKTKPSDCGPSYPCGMCGSTSSKKSQDCGPSYPCGKCGSQKKSQDCGPKYPCGLCGSPKSASCGPPKSTSCGPPKSTSCGPSKPASCGQPKSTSFKSQKKSSCGENVESQQMCSKCCPNRPQRQPMISSDELCPSSQCPGEQENYGLACCECADCIDETEEYSDDDTCDTCPECFNVLRPPFSERAEDDVVPVMPMYCSQHNIYDPELDEKTCTAKSQKRDEEWNKMLTCECENAQLSELYGKLKEDDGKPKNPPVRYDTTGCLSPAFGGEIKTEELEVPTVRYDNTGKLSAAYNHPPIRYDTTGAMSSAYQGGDPTLKYYTSQMRLDLRLVESTPGMMESSLQDAAFKASGMGKQSYSDALLALQAKKKKIRTCWRPPPKSRKYIYTWGGTYPGVKIGHRYCIDSSRRVPSRMGWTWDKPSLGLKYRPGWRPGAVNKSVMKIMRAVKKAAGLRLKALSRKDKGLGDAENAVKPQLPPTLHVHRRDGAYYISMHPMNLEPEENNVPLQFRIPAKKKEEGEEDSCECDESDASSELEIEFMAPGVYWPSDKDKKTANTQCFESEFPPDPEQQFLLELQARQQQSQKEDKGNGKGKSKKDKKGKKGKKDKGPDPDTSPRLVGWDDDDQPTAVGRKK
ncbi:hypothetical protein C0J52_10377 [Blattella germanica]|nr:hypothetical protein C0J52_10377 [Blattella germanica]